MQRPRRVVAADERDLETQFVQPVVSLDVAEPPFTYQRTQRALDGRAQPRDYGLTTAEIGVAPGHLALERRSDLAFEIRGGEVDLLQDGVHHRAGQRAAWHVGQSERDRAQAIESRVGRHVGSGRRPNLLVRDEGLLRFASDRGQSMDGTGDARIGHTAPSDVEDAVEAGRVETRGGVRFVVPLDGLRFSDALDRDLVAERLEGGNHLSVGVPTGAVRGNEPGRATVEQKPRQRRMLGILDADPPQHGLVLCPCQGHVEEAEILTAALVELHLLVDGEVSSFVADVDRALATHGVVEERDFARVRPPVPHERTEDDGKLEAFAPVDGDDLHRVGIRLKPAGALLALGVARRVVDPSAQPRRHGGRTEPFGHACLVEQLRDVAQVRHEALSRSLGQHATRHAVGAADRLEERCDALVAQESGPLVQ